MAEDPGEDAGLPLLRLDYTGAELKRLPDIYRGLFLSCLFAWEELGHAGKLGKLSGRGRFLDWRMLFSLRLAFVLCRRRADVELPEIKVSQRADALEEGFEVRLPKAWVEANPLVEYSLGKEADEWERIGIRYKVVYV